MNIHFHHTHQFLTSSMPTSIPPRFKPVVYIVAAVAIAILMIQCYRPFINGCRKGFNKVVTGFVPKKKVTFENLMKNSQEFAKNIPFKTEANLMQNFAKTEKLQTEVVEHAAKTHPLLHSHVWSFIPKFLKYKKEYGSAIEKELYKNLTSAEFVDRLIKKRPIVFFN